MEPEHDNKSAAEPDPAGVIEKQVIFQSGDVDYSTAQGMRFYANHAAASATLFDIRLVFSDIEIAGDHLKAIQTLTILMSPELAQMVHALLGRTLQNYKTANGPLRIPEKLLSKIGATRPIPEDPQELP